MSWFALHRIARINKRRIEAKFDGGFYAIGNVLLLIDNYKYITREVALGSICNRHGFS